MRAPALAFSLFFSFSLFAATEIYVTNTNDSGPGSLRAAIEEANAGEWLDDPYVIVFRIPPPVPAEGWFTIKPQSLLPFITKRDVSIDGARQTGFTGDTNPHGPEIEIDGSDAGLGPGLKYVRAGNGVVFGVAVNRFQGNGIVVDGGEGNHVIGCYLGMDPAGSEARPNGGNGIVFVNAGLARIDSNNIGGNRGNGILLRNVTGTIANNRIGLGRTSPIPNGASGIDIASHAAVHSNEIAYNTLHGVLVSSNQRAEILGNRIHRNGLLSIDYGSDGPDASDALDTDAGHPNAPLIEGVREVWPYGPFAIQGRIYSKPDAFVKIQFFAAPHRQQFGLAEAAELAGEVTVRTDVDGFAQFSATGFRGGFIGDGWLSATATTEEGTSELSDAIPLDTEAFDVTTTADSGAGSLRDVIAAVNAAACDQRSPCAIAFRVSSQEELVRFSPETPLPAITNSYVLIDGASQRWYTGASVEIRGTLQLGSEAQEVAGVSVMNLHVRGGEGDGIRGFSSAQNGVALRRVEVSDSARGVVLRGSRPVHPVHEAPVGRIAQSTIRDNRGDGIVLEGAAHLVEESLVRGNGGRGVFAGSGAGVRVERSTVTQNAAAGIAAAPDAVGLYSDSAIFANSGKAIDRGDSDRVPEIFSATFDDATGLTIVRGRAINPRFFANTSGAREGERPRLHRLEGRDGELFVYGVQGIPRGAFVTATDVGVQQCRTGGVAS
jgi:hypothetical protein